MYLVYNRNYIHQLFGKLSGRNSPKLLARELEYEYINKLTKKHRVVYV